jgi:hypothetical protein
MTYKKLHLNEFGHQIYAKINDDGTSNYSCIEEDPVFQKWLAEGNEPLPPDEPETTE